MKVLLIAVVFLSLAVVTLSGVLMFQIYGGDDGAVQIDFGDGGSASDNGSASDSDSDGDSDGDGDDEMEEFESGPANFAESSTASTSGMEVNVATQGTTLYTNIGVMTTTDNPQSNVQKNIALPLFGKETHPNSGRWNYYTMVAGQRIPMDIEERDCSDENTGCKELHSDDKVTVNQLGDAEYTVAINKPATLHYLPPPVSPGSRRRL
jgi:hypothetical protein